MARPGCLLNEPWTSADPQSYMRQLCTPGYYGPVCSLCVTSGVTSGEKTYGRVGTLECKPCRSKGAIISAYVANGLLVMAWLSFTIHVTLVENEEAAAGQAESQRTSQLIRVRPSFCCPQWSVLSFFKKSVLTSSNCPCQETCSRIRILILAWLGWAC